MNVLITNGIKVSVVSQYQPSFSNPKESEYFFSYKIEIENQSEYTVQLISRYWCIEDSNTETREVKGLGVVGVQPILNPGQTYRYSSGCPLNTEIGRMFGTFYMIREIDGEGFEVNVPDFLMVTPSRLN